MSGEIYRGDNVSVFEVDGAKAKVQFAPNVTDVYHRPPRVNSGIVRLMRIDMFIFAGMGPEPVLSSETVAGPQNYLHRLLHGEERENRRRSATPHD